MTGVGAVDGVGRRFDDVGQLTLITGGALAFGDVLSFALVNGSGKCGTGARFDARTIFMDGC